MNLFIKQCNHGNLNKKVLTDFFTRQNYGSQKFNHSKLYIVEIGYSEQIYHSGKFPLYPGMTVNVMGYAYN